LKELTELNNRVSRTNAISRNLIVLLMKDSAISYREIPCKKIPPSFHEDWTERWYTLHQV